MTARVAGPSLLRLAGCTRAVGFPSLLPRRCLSQTALSKTWSTPLSAPCAARLNSAVSFALRRTLATSPSPSNSPSNTTVQATQDAEKAPDTAAPPAEGDPDVYDGPLATTFRRLKILSLASLTLTSALSPFFFILDTTSVPVVGRLALAGIAMATSGVSTALVAWCGRPYVTHLRFLHPQGGAAQAAGSGTAVEMTTLTLALHPRVTTVYDTAFLVPTSRPFATWELAEAFRLPEAEVAEARAAGLIPRDETIAETCTKEGERVGSWVVSWDENGVGTCKEIGKVARYFNVHQELLGRPIR